MLTPNTVAVKFDLPLTPEQQACSMDIDKGLNCFWRLVEYLQHAADERKPIDQVEETIFRGLLATGRGCSRRSLPSPVQGMLVQL